jgi:hypothetical protein
MVNIHVGVLGGREGQIMMHPFIPSSLGRNLFLFLIKGAPMR